ncbi:MAG TPA: hypothetical protein VNJ08_09260 [Bacteriovoracaceae bacterium]|nr:hypothetical protein [Bacteriovoracaceae bacterium]
MIKFVLLFIMSAQAMAYVPTVESLFRHGGNQDVTSNTITMNLRVSRVQPGGEKPVPVQDTAVVKERRAEDFFKLYITSTNGDSIKLAQVRYSNSSYNDSSLEHKIYYPNFSPFTIKANADQVEKGIFFALMKSLTLNDGEHLVNYLKSLGVPVKLNNELINREKIEYLASYKRYLISTNRDRKKDAENPLRPEDATERAKVEKAMNESMYVDNKQVKLSRNNAEMAWLVNAGAVEAVVSYEKRHPIRLTYKTGAGDFEITCHDYWLSNGTHFMPKFLTVKNPNGETFQVDITGFRHYTEKDDDLANRLKKWDQVLRGKESTELRPEFLL